MSDQELMSLEDLAADVCGRCGTGGCEVSCVVCKLEFHRRCLSRIANWTSNKGICDSCTDNPNVGDLNRTIGRMPRLADRVSFNPEQVQANSTVSRADFEELQKKYQEMERLVRRLTMGPDQFPPTRQVNETVAHNVSQPSFQVKPSVNRSDRESWQEQASRLNETFGLNETMSLTKEQRDMRKTINTKLPLFSGEARQWVGFVTEFARTTNACGFTDLENKERLLEALQGEPLRLVKDKLMHHRNIDDVMQRLQQVYGQPVFLLSGMRKMVEKMPPLSDSLDNLAEIVNYVEDVDDVFKILGHESTGTEILYNLEMLLPFTYRREWNKDKQRLGDTVSGLAKYLNSLLDEAIANGVNVTGRPRMNRSPLVREPPRRQMVLLANAVETCPNTRCGGHHKLVECPEFMGLNSHNRWQMVKGLRRCLLCLGDHFKADCPEPRICGVNGCQGEHHEALHFLKYRRNFDRTTQELNSTERTLAMKDSGRQETYFSVLPVLLYNGELVVKTYAFLDTGSSVTIMKTSLARKLGLRGDRHRMPMQWTNTETTYFIDTEKVVLNVGSQDGSSFEITAHTMDNLDLPCSSVPAGLLQEEELSVPIDVIDKAKPDILIGQDNAALMRILRSQLGKSGRVVASETPLGWFIGGSTPSMPFRCLLLVSGHHIEDRLETLVEQYINTDNFGVTGDQHVESDDNMMARKIMEDTTLFKDDRYETALLWKNSIEELPDNKELVIKRHLGFEKKMKRTPDLWRRVDQLMKSYLAKGYSREVHEEEKLVRKNKTWYLNIFTVFNPEKPEKLRVVWDAAAKYHGVSLNDALMTGPDLSAPLVDILLRFRSGKFAVTGDIQEMFHQISVAEEDRSSLRFFWRSSDNENWTVHEMCRLIFGATCSPTQAQFVKNLNARKWDQIFPEAASAIIQNHYVDDYLESSNNEAELAQLIIDVKEVHRRGGFNIHKWATNSTVVTRSLGLNDQFDCHEFNQSEFCSVLGLLWECKSDILRLKIRMSKLDDGICEGKATPTKRSALRTVMSIYDPLGLINYKTVEVKLILRETWREKISWDDELPEHLRKRWNLWGTKIKCLEAIQVPRWFGIIGEGVQLHIFCDASENAIAAVGYIVQPSSGARSMCFSKCRVAPLKMKTIPRLELDAAVLGIKVLDIIVRAAPCTFTRTVFWTDARDVLYWIRSTERKYTTYVANRVSIILASSSIDQWRWVPTDDNPADMATKTDPKRKTEDLWWQGPSFLEHEEEDWPGMCQDPVEILEARRVAIIRTDARDGHIAEVHRISKWLVLVRATARVKLFVDMLRKRRDPGSELSQEDEHWATNEIIKMVQRDTTKEQLVRLSPFVDKDGLLRVRGRTAKGEFNEDQKHPIILVDHLATRLLILYYHDLGGHQNYFRTLNEIRQRFMIPRLRWITNSVVRSCQICRVHSARPKQPEMAELPRCRLAVNYPIFSFVGVDAFGPMEVTKFRRKEKRWGILFTCLTTRAVYIELVMSMNAASCLFAIESFVTRRNLRPVEFFSDNGGNFVAASRLYRGPDGNLLKWTFNPPGCPHMGGAWERLIGAAKRAMKRVDFSSIREEEELRRTMMRAERIVNSRPLTEYPVDEDTRVCLTPQQILDGARQESVFTGLEKASFDPEEALTEREGVIQSFWTAYVRECVPALNIRTKWYNKTTPLSIGSLVYFAENDYKDGWKRGVVEEIFRDPESGQVRRAVVRTANGKKFSRGVVNLAQISTKI